MSRQVTLLGLCALVSSSEARGQAAATYHPLDMEFRRLAARRFVFDNNLPLCELQPDTVVALDLMHPYRHADLSGEPEGTACNYATEDGYLAITNNESVDAYSTILVGGMNPFAVYDVGVQSVEGSGHVGIELSRTDSSQGLQVVAEYAEGKAVQVVARYHADGERVLDEPLTLARVPEPPYTLRVQMMGTGVGVYLEKNGVSMLQGVFETHDFVDFRDKVTFMDCKFRIATHLTPESRIEIDEAKSYLSCGVGQADIRMVTRKDGSPYWQDGRLWFLFTARGWLLPHATQGVLSLDPTVFDPRFEGTIVFDLGDGKLRNDVATHIFHDEACQEWRGWSCNFSTVIDGTDRKPSGINYVWSKRSPLKGFSVMQARAAENITDKHEDPCGVWDEEAGKWRMLLSSFHDGIKASLWESDHWDGPFTKIAGPVPRDSTGTLIQTIGGTRYVFAGSSDQAVYVYAYPALELVGSLAMDYYPWNDSVKNGRVWPNIFPMPEGHPYPYMAMMMDRANFPNLEGWTYGALYLYGAVPTK